MKNAEENPQNAMQWVSEWVSDWLTTYTNYVSLGIDISQSQVTEIIELASPDSSNVIWVSYFRDFVAPGIACVNLNAFVPPSSNWEEQNDQSNCNNNKKNNTP